MFVLFGSQIISKFIRVLLLPMVLSIIISRSCQMQHSQGTFIFLDLLRGLKIFVVYLIGWVTVLS
jgi:hypothetical protein